MRRRFLGKAVGILAGLVVGASVWAQDFERAAGVARSDLEGALKELAGVQQQIADEKIPLAKRLNELEDTVIARRREADRVQRLQDSRVIDLKTLETEVRARKDEYTYLASLLGEYVRSFGTRIHPGERQLYRGTVEGARLVSEDVNLEPAQKFGRQIEVVQAALDRLEKLLGGYAFDGEALSPGGTMEPGRYAVLGPIALFASSRSAAAGVVQQPIGTVEPTVIEIGPDYVEGIRGLTGSGRGELPFDPTLVNALKIASVRESWIEHLRKGGPVMIPILLLGLTAALVALLKYVQISRIHMARPSDLQLILEALGRGEPREAVARAQAIRGPAGEMLVTAVNAVDQEKELIEEALYERLLHTRPRLERFLPFIALTAACSPLLGLLGTVTGMINTFKLITVFGTGDPKMLSTGISEALITTEYGLIIAIPSLLIHALISRKARGVLASMEQTAVGFINGIPGRA